jgi:tellurite resistance protein TerC
VPEQSWLWIGFITFVLVMLALDLGVFHRKAHEVSLKESLVWSAVWIALALLFNVGIWFWQGGQAGMEFLSGYLIERALSVDNIFVFVLIFSYFQVPRLYQHKVLFWGILTALIMRAVFIVAGITLLEHFHWLIYVFGAFLVFTGIKMVFSRDQEIHPDRNPVLKFFRRVVPVTENYEGGAFFVTRGGRRWATPLVVALLFVEVTDVIFAVDSIPAILAITQDPFIVYSSNMFAILGMRALYFALAGIMRLFHYLHYGLAAILVFVGVKMALLDVYKIPTVVSLGMITAIILASVVFSLLFPAAKSKGKGAHRSAPH